MHACERHAYEMVYGRCTPIKCLSIGDVCLEDAFNQSIQIAFYHLGPPNGLAPCDLDVCVVGVVVIETACPGKTELHPDILRRTDVRVVVEFEPQSRIEGEIQQMESDFVVAELTDVLAGRRPGRVSEREVTVFDSVGFALEDFSSLRYLRRIHQESRGLQQQVDLVPDLENPKDLVRTPGAACRRSVTRPAAVFA